MTLAEPIPIMGGRKPFDRDGLGYVWHVAEHGIEFRADYLSGRGDELHGEIAVTLRGRHLHLARFNLSSSVSRKSLRSELGNLTKDLELPWERMVEQFCVGVLRKEREGQPTLHAQHAERRRLTYLADNLVIKGKTNMLFAPGGSGKGQVCVALCASVSAHRGLGDLTVMNGRPFYFDWEDDFETFEDRLNAIANGLGIDVPPVAYRRMRGLASDRINEMARAIAEEGADFAIIDSFSAAGGTTSDKVSWDTVAHRLFDALDLIPNMSWLIIDHVTGATVQDPSGKAYGSIQKMNRVRNAWEMRADQEPGSDTVHMRFYHAKWNHTGKKRPFGLRMDFSNDEVRFMSEDPMVYAQQFGASVADRMAIELGKGPLSVAMLAVALNVKENAIRSELSRHRDRFERDERGYISLRAESDEALPW